MPHLERSHTTTLFFPLSHHQSWGQQPGGGAWLFYMHRTSKSSSVLAVLSTILRKRSDNRFWPPCRGYFSIPEWVWLCEEPAPLLSPLSPSCCLDGSLEPCRRQSGRLEESTNSESEADGERQAGFLSLLFVALSLYFCV